MTVLRVMHIRIGASARSLKKSENHVQDHSRTQSPSYARSTDGDEGLWPNPYQTGI